LFYNPYATCNDTAPCEPLIEKICYNSTIYGVQWDSTTTFSIKDWF